MSVLRTLRSSFRVTRSLQAPHTVEYCFPLMEIASAYTRAVAPAFVKPKHFFASTTKSYYWANQTPSYYSETDIQQWVAQFPQLQGYAVDDIKKWRNAFDTYDHDKDGFISPADFQKNPNLSLQKVQLLKEYDRDNNNLIDFGEFVEAISALDIVDIRRFFEGFDPVDIQMEFEKFAVQMEGYKTKIMGLPQLKRLMNYCDCMCVTDKDAQRLLSEMDAGNDAAVDFEEFRTWLFRPKVCSTE